MQHSEKHTQFLSRLQDSILALLDGDLKHEQVNFLVNAAQSLAVQLLSLKFIHRPGLRKMIAMDVRDLGVDAIADLFERDEHNQLLHFKIYFSSVDAAALSREELLLHFRRLISSAVNQHVMHLFRDLDPGLGKIIRNIKLSVISHKTVIEIDRFDELCIAPIHAEMNEHLPALTQELLFQHLESQIKGNELIPGLLSILSRCLREQTEYSRIVPLIMVAIVFRDILVSKQSPIPENEENSSASFETRDLVSRKITQIQESVGSIYSRNKHVNIETMTTYFAVIRDVLEAKMNSGDGVVRSLYDGMKTHEPKMSSSEYHKCHRSKLEYFYKLCREAIADELRGKK
jgi:hypothetical protein